MFVLVFFIDWTHSSDVWTVAEKESARSTRPARRYPQFRKW